MRYVTIPANIQVNDPAGNTAAIEFIPFLVHNTWTSDRAYGESVDTLLEAMDVRSLFKGKKPGDVVQLTDGVYDRLAAVAKRPSGGYLSPGLMLQLMPMLDAVLKAPKELPVHAPAPAVEAPLPLDTAIAT